MDDIRSALEDVRLRFAHVIDSGGMPAPYFKEDDVRRTGERLRSLTISTDHEELRATLENVADTWDEIAEKVPSERTDRFGMSGLSTPPNEIIEDQEDLAAKARQVHCAEYGRKECRSAIELANRLHLTA